MAHLKITQLLTLVFITFISSTVALHHKKVYRKNGEQCVLYDLRAQCDSSLGLLCVDSGLQGYRCSCPSDKLHAQVFDGKQNACVGKVFNACVRGNSRETVLNDTLCVDNAECNTNVYGFPICLCKEGFIEMEDGSCTPALKYGDICGKNDTAATKETTSSSTEATTATTSGSEDDDDDSKRKCDIKRGHACIEGKCQCKYPSEQYYDDEKQICISFAGGRCSHDRHIYSCVPNANCPAPLPTQPSRQNPVVQPGSFLDGLLQEGNEMFAVPIRSRPRPHNFPGGAGMMPPNFHHHHPPPHLPPQLHILTKHDPALEFDTRYDHFDYARSIFFGGKGQNSQDSQSDESSTNGGGVPQPKCQCAPGYSRTGGGFCMKDYGSKCHPDDDNDSNSNHLGNGSYTTNTRELCNPDQFLECLDAHDGSFSCQCRNPLNERYDVESKQCVSRIGKRCRPVGNYPKCDKGGDCLDGVCKCVNGTSLTPLETCELDHGEKCEPGKCNSWKGFTCHGKSRTCLCLDSYLRYDPKKDACVSGEGGVCGSVPLSSIFGRYAPEIALIDCEEGLKCKVQEIAGKQLASACMREKAYQ